MLGIKLFLLGPPRVEIEGQLVVIQRRRVKALLFYLAVTDVRHQRETLATLLWPDSDQKQAHGSLRRHLSELNEILGGDQLDADRETVGLPPTAALWLDVAQFQHHLAACQTHDHANGEVCPVCIPSLAQAATLYRDDFLTGFTLPDCPEYDDWQFFQSESLRQTFANTLDRLVRAHREQGEWEAAISYARRRLGLDRVHEPAHCQLIQLYAETGQQAAALRQYQLCVKILQDELDVSPNAETTALYDQIKSGVPNPNRPIFPSSSTPLPCHNLPAQTTSFVGREAELAELHRLCTDPAIRLVTILGPGGMGKTRLALEAAGNQRKNYRDGVYFVSLAPLGAVEHIVPAIADAINFPFQVDERSPKQQLLDTLRPKQMLLVLDNFEHLLDGVDLVQELLQAGPDLQILVTSRERLQLSGETVFTLDSLAFPTWETPKEASACSAVQLFVQTARRVCTGFELTANNLQYITRICRLVGGMPLGIILAATWMETLSPTEIAAELTRGFDFLETDLRDLPDRQRSMRAMLTYSWQRLTEVERDLFTRLSVFRGGFTRQAAQSVTGASLQTLAHLVHKSFVQRTPGGRYEIHELLRQYAAEQLDASAQTKNACDAHCVYYLDFLHQGGTALASPQQLTVLAELEADFENVRTTWQWAVQERKYAAVDQALEGLFRWFWLMRNRQQEGRALLRLAREQWTPAPTQTPHPVWGRILARVLDVQGPWLADPGRAMARIEQALALAERRDDNAEIAFCLWALGFAHMGEPHHNSQKAIVYFERSLNLYQQSQDRFYTAQLLQDMGHTYRKLWQVEKAFSYLQPSLRLRHEMGDVIGQANCTRELGWAAFVAGNAPEAERYWQQAYTIRQQVGDRQGIADSLFTLSLLSLAKGDWEEGRKLALDVLEIAQDIGSTRHKKWARRELEIAASIAAAEQSLPLPAQNSPNTIFVFEVALLHLAFMSGTSVYFKRQLQVALTLAGHDVDRARCLPFAAMLLASEGEPERAVTVLALAYRFPEVAAGWVGKYPMVCSLRDKLKAALPPDRFAAAWEGGQALNLEITVAQFLSPGDYSGPGCDTLATQIGANHPLLASASHLELTFPDSSERAGSVQSTDSRVS